jgi:heme-degrading monooxygenase HmoA
MIARVLRVDVAAERIDAVVAAYRDIVRPIHARAEGLLHHYVLGDPDSGEIAIIGVWESADAINRIAGDLEPARRRLWESFDRSPEISVYEVLDDLHGPPA